MLCVHSGRRGSISVLVLFPQFSSPVTGAGFASSDCVGSKELALNPAFPLSPILFNFY